MNDVVFDPLDWVIVVLFLALSLGIGLFFSKKAGKSLSEFFLSGRNLPWYMAGLSMVATTFAADTPLLVTELVRSDGISGNWLWWNMCIGGMLTTFFFAQLWRRAGVLTELEFLELRYSGKIAAILRGFKSVYLGVFLNAVIIGWVNVAMMSIIKVFFGIPDEQLPWIILALMGLTVVYASISGLYGVVFTDAFQFLLAMGGTIVLAIYVINSPEIGGISGLEAKVPSEALSFLPKIGSQGEGSGSMIQSISMLAFISFVGVQWWASWYPGAEPGGGGYVAQRMMSSKNEKHAVYGTLFFNIAHYCLRPWPWILVGLATIVLYPELQPEQYREGYVMTISQFMPMGLKGLIFAAFLAAYMSTISTQFNWGAGFLVNDCYKRFIRKDKSEKHYVASARIATIFIMLASLLVTLNIGTIESAWVFLIQCGAGLGMVLILRWFWWRISAWTELTATIAPIFGYLIAGQIFEKDMNTEIFLFNTGFTTVSWVIVTLLTPPEREATLHQFYQRVKPGGWWKHWSREDDKKPFAALFAAWFVSVVMVYSALFLIGYLIFGRWEETAISAAIFLVTSIIIIRLIKAMKFVQE